MDSCCLGERISGIRIFLPPRLIELVPNQGFERKKAAINNSVLVIFLISPSGSQEGPLPGFNFPLGIWFLSVIPLREKPPSLPLVSLVALEIGLP